MSSAITTALILPPLLVQSLHWIAGFVVLAEALNKLERCNLFARGLSMHKRMVMAVKVSAWMLLALGAGGAIITPLLQMESPTLHDAAIAVGFALLIIRTRLEEAA